MHINFAVKGLRLATGYGEHFGEKKTGAWTVMIDAKLDGGWRDKLRITTGEKSEDLPVGIHIGVVKEGQSEALQKLHPLVPNPDGSASETVIGFFHYYRAFEDQYGTFSTPAGFGAELYLPEPVLRDLFDLAKAGRTPTHLGLIVGIVPDGMRFGWEPDGSGKDWDNAKTPQLPVIQANFVYPVLTPEEDKEVPEPFQEPAPPSPLPPDLRPLLMQISQRLVWVIWLLVFVVAAVIWRRH